MVIQYIEMLIFACTPLSHLSAHCLTPSFVSPSLSISLSLSLSLSLFLSLSPSHTLSFYQSPTATVEYQLGSQNGTWIL